MSISLSNIFFIRWCTINWINRLKLGRRAWILRRRCKYCFTCRFASFLLFLMLFCCLTNEMHRPGMIGYCSVCPSLSSHSQSCQCLQRMQMGNLWMPRLNHSYVCSGLTVVAIWVAWTLWDRSMLCINSWGYSEQVSVTQVRHDMLPPAILCAKAESWRRAPPFSAQIDLAFEKIVNCFFYFFLSICAVSILGFDLWAVSLGYGRI